MCDKLKPSCCITSQSADKTVCAAQGGTVDTNPCNILNVHATSATCVGSQATKGLPNWAIAVIAIVILIGGGIAAYLYFTFSQANMMGGRRGFNVLGNLKKLKW